jgi:hypothetical protein
MGYCTKPILKGDALFKVALGGEVVSASKVEYFDDYAWTERIVDVQLKDDNKTIFFQLDKKGQEGEFVEFESSKPFPHEW